jgi:hypothetical protein
VRREYGRRNKQEFYRKELEKYAGGGGVDLRFTDDLSELAGNSDAWGNLKDKMAVVYVDGNGIGALQREKCATWTAQQEFSLGLRKMQAAFLGDLLKRIDADDGWKNAGKLRLETLLWGGDELVWVVPAWRGWELLQFFYEESLEWKLLGARITHAAGLVFCHHKAPIHEIVRLAKDLAGMAKSKGKHRQEKNLFAYQVLESFDHIGRAMDEGYLRNRYPFYAGTATNPLVLEGGSMKRIAETMPKVRRDISRKKLFEMAKAVMTGQTAEADRVSAVVRKRLLRDGQTEALSCSQDFGEDCEHNHACWYHIAELMDYVAPEGPAPTE